MEAKETIKNEGLPQNLIDSLEDLGLAQEANKEYPGSADLNKYIHDRQAEMWLEILKLSDRKIRLETVKKLAERGNADFVLGKIDELYLTPEETEELLIFLTKGDPESFVFHIESILPNLSKDYKIRLAGELIKARPDLFLSKINFWKLTRPEERKLINSIVDNHPTEFAQNSHYLMGRGWSKSDFEDWDKRLSASITKTSTDKPVQEVIRITSVAAFGIENNNIPLPETKRSLIHLREKAFRQAADGIFQSIERSRHNQNIQKKLEEPELVDWYYRNKAIENIMGIIAMDQGHELTAKFGLNDGATIFLLAILKRADREIQIEIIRNIIKKRFEVEIKNLPPDNKRLLLDFLLRSIDFFDETKDINISILFDLIYPARNQEEEDFFASLALKFAEADMMSIAAEIIEEAKLSSENGIKLISKLWGVHPEQTIFLVAEKKEFKKYVTDKILLEWIESYLLKDPYMLAFEFRHLVFDNQKTEDAIIKRLAKSGIEPFSLIDNPRTLRIALKHGAFKEIWTIAKYDKEKALSYIQNAVEFKKGNPDQVWMKFVELSKDSRGADITELKPENLNTFAIIVERYPELLKLLDKTVADKRIEKWQFWLLMHHLTPENLPKIIEKCRGKWGDELHIVSAVLSVIGNTRIESIKKDLETIISQKTLIRLAFDILESPNPFSFFLLLKQRGKEIEEFLENRVVGNRYAIKTEIIESENPEERFEFFLKHADEFGYTSSEHQRLSEITHQLIIERGDFSPKQLTNLFTTSPHNSEAISLSEISKDQIIANIEKRLINIFGAGNNIDNLKQAEERNKIFAAVFTDKPLELPAGTLMHFSDTESTRYILSQANMCGECVGIGSKPDGYPFFVDSIRASENWPSLKMSEILSDPKKKYYSTGIIYLYPFRTNPDSFGHKEEYFAPGSSYQNHTLFFVGLPRTELGGIVYLKNPENKEDRYNKDIESIKTDIVNSDIYIPIFDENGNLIFSYEDFQVLYDQRKPYKSPESLLERSDFLESLDIPQSSSAHEFTLKKHLLLTRQYAQEYCREQNLSEEITQIVAIAAILHDIGKEKPGQEPQEISNVEAAQNLLQKVRFLSYDQRRIILTYIRNDELLGEILQGTTIKKGGKTEMNPESRKKLKRFEEIFANKEKRKAMVCLYRADVKAIGNNKYQEWEIEEKLKALNLI